MPISAALTAPISLVAVLGLIWFAGMAVRRGWLNPPVARPGGSQLELLQTLPLDSRRRLYLVRCDGRSCVLLTGGPQDLLVGWLAAEHGPP